MKRERPAPGDPVSRPAAEAVESRFNEPLPDDLVSHLPDADMQAAPRALLRAARRAREIARQTNTYIVIMRDGVLVKERVTDDDLD